MLTLLEQLETAAQRQAVDLKEYPLPERVRGLYFEEGSRRIITLNTALPSQAEACCVMAEELGHCAVGGGDLLFGDLDPVLCRRAELRARGWAYRRLLPPRTLLRLLQNDTPLCDIAERFGVTEDFVESAVGYYEQSGDLPPR